jgi:flagellar protein FliO/FliZ
VIVEALFSGGASSYKILFAVVAVVVVLALAFWALRRFGSSRLRGAAARGRQPRLAVIDSATVDGRRRLLLIRRDNVEHLLMIGGPTDVVVEQNILRATPARDVASPRPAGAAAAAGAADTLPRPVPLGEASLWPLQPEPAQKVEPTLHAEPRAEPPRPETPRPGAPVRERKPRATDPLAGLAEELSRVAPPAGDAGTSERPPARRVLRPQPAAGDGEAKSAPSTPPAPDQNLSEMAQRLEAAMRRPARSLDKAPEKSDSGRPAEAAPVKPASEAAAAAQPAAPQKSAYDNLEEEMASLLGRPTGKS